MKLAMLTGGGDCPGLNAVIRAIVRKASVEGIETIGIRYGWKGLIDKQYLELDLRAVSGILPKGGTILGTSRTNPYKVEGAVNKIKENWKALGLDALVAIGGEDTLGVATRLHSEEKLKIVGVPKTIDNDLSGTDFTFGFDTAINIVMENIDRLHTTAESHNRIMVVEVMGRHAGWIACMGGMAGGADVVLIPEIPIDIDEVCQAIKQRHDRGKNFSIVVVAEGAKLKEQEILQEEKLDQFGHVRLGGIGRTLAEMIEEKTGFETRVTVLGHIQRGGTPSAYDRILGTRYGIKAVELVMSNKFGYMAALKGSGVVDVPLREATKEIKTLDMKFYDIAKVFFG